MEINLLELTNGVTELIADLEVGTYDEIRLHAVDAKVTLKDGLDYYLKIPSGSCSGFNFGRSICDLPFFLYKKRLQFCNL